MNDQLQSGVALLCCSHNRAEALAFTIDNKQQITNVDELIFILDGPDAESEHILRQHAALDSRIRLAIIPHQGIQAARNYGLGLVRHQFTLLLDDDDLVPIAFADDLRAVAEVHGAVAVGGGWCNRIGVGGALSLVQRDQGWRGQQDMVQEGETLSPFLNANCLVQTEEARIVAFDPGFRGNAWREESDFFLRLWQRSPTIIRTSRTYSWLQMRFTGGHSRRRLPYEYWVLVNEFKFLRRHGPALATLDPSFRGLWREFGTTAGERWRDIVKGKLRRIREQKS